MNCKNHQITYEQTSWNYCPDCGQKLGASSTERPMSKTPRTDAAKARYIEWKDRQLDSDMGGGRELVKPVAPDGWATAASLETELSAKEAECERWKRQHEIVRDERAASFAMLDKAVGGTGLTEYQPEIDICIAGAIDGIKAECEALREALSALCRWMDNAHIVEADRRLWDALKKAEALAGRKEGA